MSADFNRGICDQCFKPIFRLDDKYRLGKIVKWGFNLVWQWYCNGCGAVHHERCNIVRHGEWPERERQASACGDCGRCNTCMNGSREIETATVKRIIGRTMPTVGSEEDEE